jgi:hypothetical protein
VNETTFTAAAVLGCDVGRLTAFEDDLASVTV